MNIRRLGTSVVAGLVLAAGSLAGAGSANATTWVFHYKCAKYYQGDGSYNYEADAYNQNDKPVGYAEFDANPDALHPGDALRASDSFADGWGVTAHLSTGRSVSTRGHDSPYTTGWATGNLPENTQYTIWVEMVSGNASDTSGSCTVVS